MGHWTEKLIKLNACREAVEWGKGFGTMQEAWLVCERGDHMLWLIGKLSGEPESEKRKKLVITACKCARLALPYAGKNKDVAEKCITTTENWANNIGNTTISDVRAAADAAYAAADAAYAAVNAAAAAANAAAYAMNAAYAAADAAEYAAVVKTNTLKECADIIRTDYPDIDSLFD